MTVIKPKSLIHIGLHKTASTSLQQIWNDMPDVSLSHRFILKLTEHLRNAVEKNIPLDLEPLQSEPMFHSQTKTEDGYAVFSNECMSIYNWLQEPDEKTTTTYFDALADIFMQLAPEASVLIVVREPNAWFKSMYMQYIHGGGGHAYEQYLESNSRFLIHTLRVERMVKTWGERYGADNIHILPYELIKDDLASFFDELYLITGMPVPDLTQAPQKKNISVTPQEGEFMRQAKIFMDLFMKCEALDDPSRRVLNQIIPLVTKTMRLEFEQHKSSIVAQTVNNLPISAELNAKLPEAIQNFLKQEFIPYLADQTGDLRGYLKDYEAKINV